MRIYCSLLSYKSNNNQLVRLYNVHNYLPVDKDQSLGQSLALYYFVLKEFSCKNRIIHDWYSELKEN